jgi:hypothetical protein
MMQFLCFFLFICQRKADVASNGDMAINNTFGTKWSWPVLKYEGVFRSFRTGRPERELQMAQLSATRCSFIAIL